jgi:hypothetical protein
MSTQLRILDLNTLVLARGNHESPREGMCMLEAVAYIAGEPHSDHPECVSPVIGAFLRTWNDDLGDVERQRLKPYLARVIGTRASDEVEDRRSWLCADWMVRVHTPAWLELAGMKEQATAVRALAPILSIESAAAAAEPALQAADDAAQAAWDAAWAARAAWAAWAAWAARAAWAAWAADAARAAGAATEQEAEEAARKALEPTVLDLQTSAFRLLDMLIVLA